MTEIYFSTDVETDGPIPGPNSMLSLGSAAFLSNGALLETFSVNLEPLPESSPDPKTSEWWSQKENRDAYEQCRRNPVDPAAAMEQFSEWAEKVLTRYTPQGMTKKANPVFVGFPAGFDFLFVYWYLIRFTGKSPFSFSALDGKTYAMALLKKGYRESVKRNYPRHWFPAKVKHSHIAEQDALEQGVIFCNMLQHNLSE